MKKRFIVRDVAEWQKMAGNDDLTKKINSAICLSMIGKSNIPSDECLAEAIEVIDRFYNRQSSNDIAEYLAARFMPKSMLKTYESRAKHCLPLAESLSKIFEENKS